MNLFENVYFIEKNINFEIFVQINFISPPPKKKYKIIIKKILLNFSHFLPEFLLNLHNMCLLAHIDNTDYIAPY